MTLQVYPKPGNVVMCDYQTGFREPEMVKKRHVIVVSPKLLNELGTCLVVPVSHIRPRPVLAIHHLFTSNLYGFFTPDRPQWAKCNMLSHVGYDRLDRVLLDGTWCVPSISDDDLLSIKCCVLSATGMADLRESLANPVQKLGP